LKLIINGKHEEASMKQQHHPHTPTPTPSRQVNTFSDYLLDELARNNLNLNMYYVNLIRSKLVEYEQFNMRRFEEKDQFIGQLKQNLMELTEKRYRALNKRKLKDTIKDQDDVILSHNNNIYVS